MEELDLNKLQHIPVPRDLESRISSAIDDWDAQERKAKTAHRRLWLKRTAGVAASVAIIVAISLAAISNTPPNGHVDTYSDPRLAYEETERVLNLLASNMKRCQQELNKIEEVSNHAQSVINKSINKNLNK